MKPQAEAFIEKAQALLGRAEIMLRVGLNEDAGRTAYLAGFHAAQGLLFETSGRVFKTHKGIQGEFGRLVKDDPRFSLELRAFLDRTYDLKAIADYESGPDAVVTPEQAAEAVAAARSFVDHRAALLGDPAADAVSADRDGAAGIQG